MYTLQHLRYGDKKMVDISLSEMVPSSDAVGFQGMETKKVCKECGNKLTLLGRYIHPIHGKKHIICRTCYLKLDKIIEQWRTFVFANPTIINSLNIDGEILKNNFESTVTSIMRRYGYVINEEHSIDHQKNIPEHTIINDNKQELFPENILCPMKI